MSDILGEIRSAMQSSLDKNLKALVLADRYGTQLASASNVALPRELVAKFCAVLYGSSERLGEGISKGPPRLLAVEYEGATICIARSMTGKYLLIGLCEKLTEEAREKITKLSLRL